MSINRRPSFSFKHKVDISKILWFHLTVVTSYCDNVNCKEEHNCVAQSLGGICTRPVFSPNHSAIMAVCACHFLIKADIETSSPLLVFSGAAVVLHVIVWSDHIHIPPKQAIYTVDL